MTDPNLSTNTPPPRLAVPKHEEPVAEFDENEQFDLESYEPRQTFNLPAIIATFLLIVFLVGAIVVAFMIPSWSADRKAMVDNTLEDDVRFTVANVEAYLEFIDTEVTAEEIAEAQTGNPAAIYVVETHHETNVTIKGDWDDYTVTGVNQSTGTKVTYDSVTGEYATSK